MSVNTLAITDNRNGKHYSVPIENDTIKATDLRQIKASEGDFGLITYYPSHYRSFTYSASASAVGVAMS